VPVELDRGDVADLENEIRRGGVEVEELGLVEVYEKFISLLAISISSPEKSSVVQLELSLARDDDKRRPGEARFGPPRC
jgi:hypothetical protein